MPAPLGPRRARISPARTAREMSRTARLGEVPNLLRAREIMRAESVALPEVMRSRSEATSSSPWVDAEVMFEGTFSTSVAGSAVETTWGSVVMG